MVRSASLFLVFAAPLFAASPAQAQTVLFSDDFENGTANWLPEYWWHLADASSPCLQDTFPSGNHCMWYGREDNCWYDGVIAFAGLHLAGPFDVPAAPASTALEFWTRSEVEKDTTWDTRTFDVSTNGGASWTPLLEIIPSVEPWTLHRVDLSPYAGQSIRLRFAFWAGDGFANEYLGWLIDDVVIRKFDSYPSLCFGDGTTGPCPCSNSGAPGRGCQNSANTGGAQLTVTGETNPDTIMLQSSGEHYGSLTIFLQGTANISPVAFGDGRRCTGGALKRLYVEQAANYVAIAPAEGDLSVSQRSAALGDVLNAGSRRYYQAYYRDPIASFCPTPQGSNFNASQMRRITW